ncbi:PLP-dependent aminotransferase family protein [Telmatospirillum siberiense]|uniref:PLP-dependent aminotransferase family protein n=1 Tax=Telmatospirillum siberiense TaxID=382514 RepID=A0A2N3PPA7_9PROT|nr:PLP-dependent aminotransferase family protein [Telmatospirillum siberiense]PKU22228.1 PLP-dependent aminotransferase family protein [Telmatospirillum siberiense]
MADPDLPSPLHAQIGGQLRRAILERRLAAGTKLPSSRLMAEELDCARGTVLSALDPLIAEGYLVSRAGAGVFVATDLPDEMLSPPGRGVPATARDPGRDDGVILPEPADGDAIAFPLGQPDRHAFPFPLWARLMEREWRNPPWRIAGMPHPFGHEGLRSAIAAYLGAARGFSCDPENVVITSGVRESVSLFARIVLRAEDRAWVEDPGYPGVTQALAGIRIRAVPVPLDPFGFSPETAMATAPDARMAIVTPSHQYPLGIVLPLQRRLALLAWAEQHGGWIVEDDFDGEYRYSGRPLAPLRALDRAGRVAYLGNFSKILFPSLRLSYLVLPAPLAGAGGALMAEGPATASLLGQGALARFIADGHLAAHLRRTRLLYARRQQALIASAERHLEGLLDIAADPGGMHVIARPHPDLAPIFDDVAATRAAAAMGLRTSPLSRCYHGPGAPHGLILGYAGTPEAEIDLAVRRLTDVMKTLRPAQPARRADTDERSGWE